MIVVGAFYTRSRTYSCNDTLWCHPGRTEKTPLGEHPVLVVDSEEVDTSLTGLRSGVYEGRDVEGDVG